MQFCKNQSKTTTTLICYLKSTSNENIYIKKTNKIVYITETIYLQV